MNALRNVGEPCIVCKHYSNPSKHEKLNTHVL